MFLKQQKLALNDPRIFNPPVGYYQLNRHFGQQKKQIITGSLQGPIENDWELGKFGTEKRFKQSSNIVPGPGSYQTKLINLRNNKKVPIHPKPKKQILIKSVPSIPSQKLRYQILQKQIEIIHEQNEGQETQSPYAMKKNTPGYSFPKSFYAQRSTITPTNQHNPKMQVTNQNKQKKQGKIELTQQMKQFKQQNKKRKLQVLEMINNSNNVVPSLQILQMRKKFVKNQIPGPGFYTYNLNTILPKDIQNTKMPKKFGSKTQRFEQDNQQGTSNLGPGTYDNLLKQKSIVYPFAREKRKFSNEVTKSIPDPYVTDDYLKRTIIKKQLNFNSPFGSGTVRFNKSQSNSNIGPGSYNYTQKSKFIKSNKKLSVKRSLSSAESESTQISKLHSIQVLSNIYKN